MHSLVYPHDKLPRPHDIWDNNCTLIEHHHWFCKRLGRNEGLVDTETNQFLKLNFTFAQSPYLAEAQPILSVAP